MFRSWIGVVVVGKKMLLTLGDDALMLAAYLTGIWQQNESILVDLVSGIMSVLYLKCCSSARRYHHRSIHGRKWMSSDTFTVQF